MRNPLAQDVTSVELKELLKFYIENDGLSIFIWGKPGVGKTTMIEEMCKSKNILFENFKLSQENPITVVGLYAINQNDRTTERYFNERIERIIENDKKGNISVIFLDELVHGINTIPAIWELVNERRLGKYQFQNLRVIAASNYIEEMVAYLDNAFYSRFIHVNLEPTVEEVTNYIANKCNGIQVSLFLRANPHLMYDDKSLTHVINPRKWQRIQEMIDKNQEMFKKYAKSFHAYALQLAEMLDQINKLKTFDELANNLELVYKLCKSNDVFDMYTLNSFVLNFNGKNFRTRPQFMFNLLAKIHKDLANEPNHKLLNMLKLQQQFFEEELIQTNQYI